MSTPDTVEDLRLVVFGPEGPYTRMYHTLETLQAQRQSRALGELAKHETEAWVKRIGFTWGVTEPNLWYRWPHCIPRRIPFMGLWHR